MVGAGLEAWVPGWLPGWPVCPPPAGRASSVGPTTATPRCSPAAARPPQPLAALGSRGEPLPGPSAGLRLGHPSARARDCFLPSAGGLHTRPNAEPCRGVGVGPPTSPCPWWGQLGKGSGEATATASCSSFPAGTSDARKPRALAGQRAFLRKAPPAAAASVHPCPTGRAPQSETRGFPAGAANPAPPSPSGAGFYEKWLHSGPVASRDPGSVAQPGKRPLPTPPPNAVADSAPSDVSPLVSDLFCLPLMGSAPQRGAGGG